MRQGEAAVICARLSHRIIQTQFNVPVSAFDPRAVTPQGLHYTPSLHRLVGCAAALHLQQVLCEPGLLRVLAVLRAVTALSPWPLWQPETGPDWELKYRKQLPFV